MTSFGVELFVQSGAAFVSLRHLTTDGKDIEVCRIEQSAGGSSYSPPLLLRDFDGILLPIVENATADAVFDIYFGTNGRPHFDFGVTGFVAAPRDRDHALQLARSFIDFVTEYHAETRAHLMLVVKDQNLSAEIPLHRCMSVIVERGRDVNLVGRGLFECAYGLLKARDFTHLCILGSNMEVHGEIFVRACGFAWYIKEGCHLSALVYGRDEHDGKIRIAPSGYKFAETVFPTAKPIGHVHDPENPRTMLDISTDWDYAADGLLLFDMTHLHNMGLPHPFLRSSDLAEFQVRLRRGGQSVIVPLSFFAVHDDAANKKVQSSQDVLEQLALHVLSHPLEESEQFADLLTKSEAIVAAGEVNISIEDWQTGVSDYLKGPGQALDRDIRDYSPNSPKYLDPTHKWDILGQIFKPKSESAPTVGELRKDYARLFQWASSSTFWSRLLDSADVFRFPLAYGPEAQFDIRQHNALAAMNVQLENQRRELRRLVLASSDTLVHRLGGNRYLDEGGYRQDLDRANRFTLSLLRNRHAGQRAFVIGNGPSLKIADLDRLQGEVTFASNKIFLAYDQTPWRPTYYSVEDHLVMHSCRDQIAKLQGSIKIFPANLRDFGYHQADTLFIPFLPPKSFEDPLSDPHFPDFSFDLSHGTCWGSTITYTMIQLAVYMGITEIILIGLDHSYELPSVRVGRAYVAENEVNHFHPEYRAKGEIWHQPNLSVLETSYRKARAVCDVKGIRIFNASRKTELDIFERTNLDEILN